MIVVVDDYTVICAKLMKSSSSNLFLLKAIDHKICNANLTSERTWKHGSFSQSQKLMCLITKRV